MEEHPINKLMDTTMQKIKQHTSLMKTKTQHVKISEMQLRQC